MEKLDPATQAKLLKNPEVQEAMKKAGTEAMADPAVQKAIIDAAKKTLTAENAALVANKVKDWAKDPEVQAAARHYAGMAMAYAGGAGQAFVGCIEQGPAGVRFLAFLASTASAVLSVMNLIDLRGLFSPVQYIISGFQFIFALSTMLFEAKPEWIEKLGTWVNKYQEMLIEYCNFLTTCWGRGGFYIFQGTTWLINAGLGNLDDLIVGLFLFFIGALTVAMHFGIMPQSIAAKAKAAYGQVRGAAAAPAAP